MIRIAAYTLSVAVLVTAVALAVRWKRQERELARLRRPVYTDPAAAVQEAL